MKKKMIRLYETVAITLFGVLLLSLSFIIYKKNVGLNLSQTTRVEGYIKSTYKAIKPTGGEYIEELPVFAFRLDKVEQNLAVYRPSRNYSTLFSNLKEGDRVTVYYQPNASDTLNSDVYQIEKNGQVILDYKGYSRNHLIIAVLLALTGLIVLWSGLRTAVKNKKTQSA